MAGPEIKNIRVTVTANEFEKLDAEKNGRTWRELLLEEVVGESPDGDEEEATS